MFALKLYQNDSTYVLYWWCSIFSNQRSEIAVFNFLYVEILDIAPSEWDLISSDEEHWLTTNIPWLLSFLWSGFCHIGWKETMNCQTNCAKNHLGEKVCGKWYYWKMKWSHFFIREVFPTPEAPSTSTLRTWFHQIFRFPDKILRFPDKVFRFPVRILRFPDEILRFPDKIFRFPDKLPASAFSFFLGKFFDLIKRLRNYFIFFMISE